MRRIISTYGRMAGYLPVFVGLLFLARNVRAGGMPQDTGFWTVPSFVYRYEAGVANRISFQDIYAYSFPQQTEIALTIRFHLNENKGLGLFSLLARRIPGPFRWMKFQVEILHREYPDYYTGDNQLAGLVHFIPLERLSFMAGMAYLSPDLSENKMHSPFDWNHTINETYPLFNITWTFLDSQKIRSSLFGGNYTCLSPQNLDHLMLGLRGSYRATDHISLRLEVRSAVKGVSGFVFSVNEFQADAGMKISF